jgi:hypothetical protein
MQGRMLPAANARALTKGTLMQEAIAPAPGFISRIGIPLVGSPLPQMRVLPLGVQCHCGCGTLLTEKADVRRR